MIAGSEMSIVASPKLPLNPSYDVSASRSGLRNGIA